MYKNNLKKSHQNSKRTIRLVLLVTHGCCLQCRYCLVEQDEKKCMSKETLFKAADFLMTSSADGMQLHFFGGEPLLMPFGLIKEGITYAKKVSKLKKKNLEIVLTTNGVLLNKQQIIFFKKNKVLLEVSIDGTPQAQSINRPQNPGAPDSYQLIVKKLPLIFNYRIDCQVSMVVSPATAANLVDNFNHLLGLGFKNIFIMIACGTNWTKRAIAALKRNLAKLEKLYLNLVKEHNIILLNLRDWLSPFRMNTHISVDFDGNIYSACISYLIHDKKIKKKFLLGHISSMNNSIDILEQKRLSNYEAMNIIFKENNVLNYLENNIQAGMVMAEFVNSLNIQLRKHRLRMIGKTK